MFKEAIILKNSPVEFAIIGSYMGRDRILLRSENASLDLIGIAVENEVHLKNYSNSPISIPFLLGSPRQLNIVKSEVLHTFSNSYSDDRESSLRLVWVGLCSPYDTNRVEAVFNRLRYDIRRAILEGTTTDVELSIASVILACSNAIQKQLQKRSSYRVIIWTYVVLAILVLIYFLRYQYFALS